MPNLSLRLYESFKAFEIPTNGRPERKGRIEKVNWGIFEDTSLDLGAIPGYIPTSLEFFDKNVLEVGSLEWSNYWKFVKGQNQRAWYRPQGQFSLGWFPPFTLRRRDTAFRELTTGESALLNEGDELAVHATSGRPYHSELFVVIQVIDIYNPAFMPKPELELCLL
jgi:hypothetical protein